MIQLEHISKRYVGPSGTVDALKDVSVHVEKGDIYGIIGSSGAGKSTLLRCLNLLETPTTAWSTSWKNRIPAQSPWLAGN